MDRTKIAKFGIGTGVLLTVTVAVACAMFNPEPLVFSWSDAWSRLFWFAITMLAGIGIILLGASVIFIKQSNTQHETKQGEINK